MRSKPQSSSLFFYFVAAALGVSFTAALLILAWNNAIRNETRNFAFDAIAIRNAVEANLRTADAVTDALARFIAAGNGDSADQFDDFIENSLRRYAFVSGMGHLRIGADGAVEALSANGEVAGPALSAELTASGGERFLQQSVAVGLPAIPLVGRSEAGDGSIVFLVQAIATPAGAPLELAVLSLDLAGLVRALAIEPAVQVALYTESEGVAGRRLVYRKTAAAGAGGSIVEALGQEATVRLDRFSVRLITAKDLLWHDIEKGLIFVALVLGAGITLLLVALARAKDLQARELEARNRVIEEQVRQQTRELAEARDQALEASRVKSDFLASMSHEIRTPLNAIIGMAELLSETSLTDEQGNYVGVFKNAGEALLSLVNDILDLSKIEAEQLVLEHIDFNLVDIVEQAADIYALKADSKGVELVTSIATGVPAAARGDPGRLRQVILNLVGNAIKFTATGQIVTRVSRISDAGAALRVRVEVADSGIGIPADKLESIFTSFTQVDSSITRKYGGTGLGLTISKRLVEMMHGRIWVESVEGAGSTFKFEIALEPASAETEPVPAAGANLSPVLIVEDNAATALMLGELLSAQGVASQVTDSTDRAREELARRRTSAVPPGALVLDADLAGVGLRWLRELRERGELTPAVLMFRPSTVASGVEALRAIQATSYVVKPIKRASLLQALRTLAAQRPALTPVVPASRVEAQAAARILLVEDNPDNRLLIRAYLKKEPYEIVEAADGAEAVDRYAGGAFDLVLMDVQMPIMDGYAATRAIRALERDRAVTPTPIIALTANAIKEDMARSQAAGCDDHLTKPIKKQTLLDAIQQHLARAAGAPPAAH